MSPCIRVLRGSGWEALWLPLVVLAGMALVLFALAVVRLHASIAPAKAARPARAARRASDAATSVEAK